jgi:fused signal recognition particle receptor
VAPLLPEAPVEAPVVDLVLRAGLQKTQQGFIERINQLFRGAPKVDAAVLDALEEVLLSADVGVGLTLRLMDDLRGRLRSLTSAQQVHEALRAQLCKTLQEGTAKDVHGSAKATQGTAKDVHGFAKPAQDTAPAGQGTDAAPAGSPVRPQVILFVGVNGVGKTTSIGKIATQMQAQGRRVMLAAADTFRAAAAEQLEIWAQRSGAQMMRGRANADPASVVFDAVKQATAGDIDVVLADTAGRLHTKVELMDEIKKVKRAAGKARPGAPDETWLVVDATTGQNALQQAQEFHQALGLTGIILTKLDGTAKGGVVVAVVDALKIPVRYIGVGEQAADLRPFDAAAFVAALFDTAADRAA